eukprot:TRINITY_DN39886_c0_g1_i2.p1 TRINITY_DN39886_c0_g1~~TRINITY_DN39886_c0_g1_i2.p1  ORF type:complete len:225 (-),score=52.38 TRINITY_DN39886_c0_g1_i2:144-818(-)
MQMSRNTRALKASQVSGFKAGYSRSPIRTLETLPEWPESVASWSSAETLPEFAELADSGDSGSEEPQFTPTRRTVKTKFGSTRGVDIATHFTCDSLPEVESLEAASRGGSKHSNEANADKGIEHAVDLFAKLVWQEAVKKAGQQTPCAAPAAAKPSPTTTKSSLPPFIPPPPGLERVNQQAEGQRARQRMAEELAALLASHAWSQAAPAAESVPLPRCNPAFGI